MDSTWSYWTPNLGPLHWKMHFEEARGYRQSPIDLNDNVVRADLGPLRSDDFRFAYNIQDCASVLNAGFTWKLLAKPKCKSVLKAGHLPSGSYRLDHVHAHWGTMPTNGSEHLVNGCACAAEVHIVHYNMKYSSIEEAYKQSDGLAVLGVFLKETRSDNPVLEPIVQLMPRIRYKGQSVPLEQGFDVLKLIPENRDFWTYSGSLTNPPCCQCVTWTIFRTPLPVSKKQLDQFRSLYTVAETEARSNANRMVHNIRPVQHLHNRVLRASFTRTISGHIY